MRFLILLALLGTTLTAPADARDGQRSREQDAAFQAMQRGRILPLAAIRSRINIPDADYIGAEIDSSGTVYRLKYMRGGDVIWVDVDARTGRPLRR